MEELDIIDLEQVRVHKIKKKEKKMEKAVDNRVYVW